MKIVFSILILLCLSCNPQRQLNRLISKNPELLEKDTIRYIDTIIVENYTHDTITNIHLHDSTTVINNEKVILKYFYDTLKQEIHHYVECVGDTIIKEISVPYETIVIQELTWWQKYGSIIIILSFIVLALLLFKRIGKILL